MQAEARVSIIIPCKNDGRFLDASVDSALAQTGVDVEVIVVDDHSDDGETVAILAQTAKRVSVLHLPEQKSGVAAARNWGIAHAGGEYILPLDADDLIEPVYSAKAAAVLDANPQIGICYCNANFFGLRKGHWHLPPYSFRQMLVRNMIFITAMFRKCAWEAVGGFEEKAAYGFEDHIFWQKLVAGGAGVWQLPETLFHYRIKPNSRSAKLGRLGRMEVAAKTFECNRRIYEDNIEQLYEQCMELSLEKEEREKLLLWRFIRPILAGEKKFRNIVKNILGR